MVPPRRSRTRTRAVPTALLTAPVVAALVAATPQPVAPLPAGSGAASAGTVHVSPSSAAPGTRLDLRTGVCRTGTGVARSDAFDGDVELRAAHGGLHAEPTVRSSAGEGTYAVTVDCDGGQGTATGSLTVAGGASPSSSAPASPASPSGPVRAGGGGAERAGQAGQAGQPGSAGGTGTGGGVALVAMALAGAAVLVLRKRRSTGPGER